MEPSYTAAWPAIEFETLAWIPSERAWGVEGGRARRTTAEHYEAAIPAKIAGLTPVVSPEILALAEDASYEVSRFDAELGGEVTAFGSILLRSEAAASSQIENLSASARAILTAEIGDTSAANASAIAANTRAMSAAIDLAENLDPDSILAMHRVLMSHDQRHKPGVWRDEPVWIGTSAASPVDALYVAPAAGRVPGLIDDLMRFAGRDDLPVLAQAAIAHAQFETIHPFTDGNGRTGRSLIQAMLRSKGLTRRVTVPVSAGLLTDIDAYHAALTTYRSGNLESIVSLTAAASLRAVGNARILVSDIRDIRKAWIGQVKARRDSSVWRVLDLVGRQPVISAESVASELGIAVTNSYRYLHQLADSGILKKKTEHKIGILWRSDEVLAAIDTFAERSGRRGR